MNSKKIIIISKDGTPFELDYGIAKQSKILLSIMDKNNDQEPIKFELRNINSSVLERIVSYLVYHNEINDTKQWDNNFINKFTGYELIDLIWSANYLKIDDLKNLGKNKFLEVFKYEDVSDIRKMLGVKSDLTKEEEEIAKNKI